MVEAVVAARSMGLTPEWEGACVRGFGVLAPVARGVESALGSSEVKIVALDGEMRYLVVSVSKRASLKPGEVLVIG